MPGAAILDPRHLVEAAMLQAGYALAGQRHGGDGGAEIDDEQIVTRLAALAGGRPQGIGERMVSVIDLADVLFHEDSPARSQPGVITIAHARAGRARQPSRMTGRTAESATSARMFEQMVYGRMMRLVATPLS